MIKPKVMDMEKTLAASQALAEAIGEVFFKHNIHNEEQRWHLVVMLADDMEAELCGVFA